jgi:DtxR family transcriptional regulator, Mn-dependent transcriptional regulator
MADWHPAFEEYCECIFELAEDKLEVIQARIADRLGVSRPSVSEMIRKMEVEGLLVATRSSISLTAKGEALAQSVVRRHRLAERFLTDILHLSWAEAHHEAGKWEHVISDRVEAALNAILGDPQTCPHGNPIPGTGYAEPKMRPLVDVARGESFVVARIPEELEFADGMLDFLQEANLQPGRMGTVVTASPDGTVTVDVAGAQVGIGPFASARILVAV